MKPGPLPRVWRPGKRPFPAAARRAVSSSPAQNSARARSVRLKTPGRPRYLLSSTSRNLTDYLRVDFFGRRRQGIAAAAPYTNMVHELLPQKNALHLKQRGVKISLFRMIYGSTPTAFAQTSMTATTAVDATAARTPLEPIWACHGYDECNYTTAADGKAPLQTLGRIPPTPRHIRRDFLLNTGNAVPSFKRGSTNLYNTDAMRNLVPNWTQIGPPGAEEAEVCS